MEQEISATPFWRHCLGAGHYGAGAVCGGGGGGNVTHRNVAVRMHKSDVLYTVLLLLIVLTAMQFRRNWRKNIVFVRSFAKICLSNRTVCSTWFV